MFPDLVIAAVKGVPRTRLRGRNPEGTHEGLRYKRAKVSEVASLVGAKKRLRCNGNREG